MNTTATAAALEAEFVILHRDGMRPATREYVAKFLSIGTDPCPVVKHLDGKMYEVSRPTYKLLQHFMQDRDRLDWALKNGFLRCLAEGPMKGRLLLNREMIDHARGHINF